LGGEISLLGFDLPATRYAPGDEIHLTLYWRADRRPTQDYKVFVHLVSGEDELVAQHDAVPADWERPTLGWGKDEIIEDRHVLSLGAATTAGEYALYVGMYDSETLKRLPILASSEQRVADDRLWIADVTISP
jgi:hypothetical protein